MNKHLSFSFREALRSGWEGFKRNWKIIIVAGLATLLIQLGIRMIESGGQDANIVLKLITTIFTILIGVILSIGWSKMFLAISRHANATWDTFRSQPDIWARYIKTYLWYIAYMVVAMVATTIIWAALAIIGYFMGIEWLLLVGVILSAISLALTSLYFSVRYQFLKFAILDYPELSSRNIFRKAGSITKGAFWSLLAFMIVVGFMLLACAIVAVVAYLLGIVWLLPIGAIIAIIGFIVLIPVARLAQAHVYDILKAKHSA